MRPIPESFRLPSRTPWRGLPFAARRALAVGAALVVILPTWLGCRGTTLLMPLDLPQAQLPPYYHVDLDPDLTTPRLVENDHLIGAARPGTPGAFTNEQAFGIVRGFVTRYAPVFHFRAGLDDFRMLGASSRDGLNHVTLQQTYLGLPVIGFGYGTSVLSSGEVGSFIGRFLADVRVPVSPSADAAVAADAALAAVAPHTTVPVEVVGSPALVVLPGEDHPRLAWAFLVQTTDSFGSWTVYVDARKGGVLRVTPNVIVG